MIRLCSHHQKQFIHVLNDLCSEGYHLPDTTSSRSGCSQQGTEICGTGTTCSEVKSNSLSELHQDKLDSQGSTFVGVELPLESSIHQSTELKCTDEAKCSSILVEDHSSELPMRTYGLEEQTTEQASLIKKCEDDKDQTEDKSLVKCLVDTNVIQLYNNDDGSDSLVSQNNSFKSLPETSSVSTVNLHRTADNENNLQYSTIASLNQDLESIDKLANLRQENLQNILERNKVSNRLHNGEMNPFENSKDSWLASNPYSGHKTSSSHTKVKSNSSTIKATRKHKRASGLRINDYDNQCDVVYISQPITECHLENQRSLISSRKTARKSTRGYFFNGECCELPTVRTLVRSSSSVPERVTPNQVLMVPNTLPTREIPIVRNSQAIDGIQAPFKLLLQGTPSNKEKPNEIVANDLKLQIETLQAGPLVSRETASGPLMALLSLVHNEKSKESSSGKSKIITCSSPFNENLEDKIEQLEITVGVPEDSKACTEPLSENTVEKLNSKTVECASVCLSEATNREGLVNYKPVSPSEAGREKTMVFRTASPSEAANGQETVHSRPVFPIKDGNQEETVESRPISSMKESNQEETMGSRPISPMRNGTKGIVESRLVSPVRDGNEERTVESRPVSPMRDGNEERTVESRPVSPMRDGNEERTVESRPVSPMRDGNEERTVESRPVSPMRDGNEERTVESRPVSPMRDGNEERTVESRPVSPMRDGNEEKTVESRPVSPMRDRNEEGPLESRPVLLMRDRNEERPVGSRPISPMRERNEEQLVGSRPVLPIRDGNEEGHVESRSVSPLRERNEEGIKESRSILTVRDGNEEIESRPVSPMRDGNEGGHMESRHVSPMRDGNEEGPVEPRPVTPMRDGNEEGPVEPRPVTPMRDGTEEGPVEPRPVTPMREGNEEGPVEPRPVTPMRVGNEEGPVEPRPVTPMRVGNEEGPVEPRPVTPMRVGNEEGPVEPRPVMPMREGNEEGPVEPRPVTPMREGNEEGPVEPRPVTPMREGNEEGPVEPRPITPMREGNEEGPVEPRPITPMRDGNEEGPVEPRPITPMRDGNEEGPVVSRPIMPMRDGNDEEPLESRPITHTTDRNKKEMADSRPNVSSQVASTEDTDYNCTVYSEAVNKESINNSTSSSSLEVDIVKETVNLGSLSLSKITNAKHFPCSEDPPLSFKSSMDNADLSRHINIVPEKKRTQNEQSGTKEQSKILINLDRRKIKKEISLQKIEQNGKRQDGNLSKEYKSVKICASDRDYSKHNAVKKKKKSKKVLVMSDRCLRSQQGQSQATCIKEKPISSSTFQLPCLQIELLKKLGSKRFKRMVRICKTRYVFFPNDCFHKSLLKNIGKKNIYIDPEDLVEENSVTTRQSYKCNVVQGNTRSRKRKSEPGIADAVSCYKTRENLEISIDMNSDERKINFPKEKTNCTEQVKRKPKNTNTKNLENSVKKGDSLKLSQEPVLNSPTLRSTRNGVKPLTSRNLMKHKKLVLRSYNLRHSPNFESMVRTNHLAKENVDINAKPVDGYALENEDAIDLKNVKAQEDGRPKFVDWCTEEENQELIADFNAKYIKIQKGWIQLEREPQPMQKTKNKSDKLKEIWKTKKRVRKCRSSLEVQKLSPIQMLFMKAFKLSNICKWFLETTETRSLVIVKKLNTRIPGELSIPLIPLHKYSSSNLYPHSLQAERLKKHLKKFPGTTPLKNNWKTQKLWAKFRENNNKVETNESSSAVCISANTSSDEQSDCRDTKSSPTLKTSASTQILKKHFNVKGKVGTQHNLIKSEETNENAMDQEKVEPSRKSVCINPLMSPKLALQVKADAFSGKPGQAKEGLKGKRGKKRLHGDVPKNDLQLGKKKKTDCDVTDMKDTPSSSTKEKLPVKKANKAKHLEPPSKALVTRKQAAVEEHNKMSSKLSFINKNAKVDTRKHTIRDGLHIQKANVRKNKRRQCATTRQPVTKSKQRPRETILRLLKEMEKEKHSRKIQTRSLKNEQNTVSQKKRKLRAKLKQTPPNK
ncbi:ligand-dependent corepressor isoform X2 [Rhinatrema bivittatum]|nr:ligand-dependent corepressor isoform X2 [Rhinatrema bivittatum]